MCTNFLYRSVWLQWACYQPTTGCIASFVRSLPRVPSQLDVVVVCRGAAGPHKDFKVRRSRVLQALQWLMENNTYFRGISLDHAALAQLPENGELPGLSAVTLCNDESG